jgi:hypothetical protein
MMSWTASPMACQHSEVRFDIANGKVSHSTLLTRRTCRLTSQRLRGRGVCNACLETRGPSTKAIYTQQLLRSTVAPAKKRNQQRIRGSESKLVRFGAVRSRATPLGDMGGLGGALDSIFVTGISAAIIGGIAYSAIPLLNGEAERRNASRLDDVDEADSDDVKWGTMSVISFIPLLNWLVGSPCTVFSQIFHKNRSWCDRYCIL